jgi:pimeloyl-ACP methyl ester carboxylesterase
VVTLGALADARPEAWRAAAGGWRSLADVVADRAASIDGVRTRLTAHWRGPAADAAQAALASLALALRAVRGPAYACDQALCELAGEVAPLRGPARAMPGSSTPAAVQESLLVAADAADARAVRRLGAAASDATAAGSLAGAGPAGAGPLGEMPPAGADPAAVRRWWAGLSPADQQLLLATEPHRLGALDGIPVAVRDVANRQVLADVLAHLPPGERKTVLDALAARLQRSEPARAYLIGFDPAGDGTAIVAIGDPDRARHVVTNVPGAGSDLGDLRGLLARTERIAAAAGDGVSSVLWLGYDAPEWLSAAGTAAARDGADDLDRFAEGLRVTADGPPAHHTVVGHSYGSLVVGTAAREYGLPVDDLVFIGSPGVGVDHARDLGGPTVWASTARWDVIHGTALADRVPEWLDRGVTEDRWHGRDPGDPGFGANTFTSAPGHWYDPVAAHNAYFEEGNPALAAIGAIARGDQAAVN